VRRRGVAAALLAAACALGGGTRWVDAGQAPPAPCTPVPFGQQVDVGTVRGLAEEAPDRLLERIASLGIDVLRVPAVVPGRPPNPLLAGLPLAGPGLLARAEFRDEYDGRAIPRGSPCCSPGRDTILIRETAPTWTLLHEVVHLLIVPSDGFVPRAELEQRFALAHRRLAVYQRRLDDDPTRLLDPRWRDDIVDAQREAAALLFDRLRIGQSQEAVVERILAACIDERSPHFDAARRDEGWRYGTAMVDNAIDVFNAVNASVERTAATLDRLRDEVGSGRLAPGAGERLTAGDRQAFAAAQRGTRQALERAREEIEALKRFEAR
jgi:hypothetical protein